MSTDVHGMSSYAQFLTPLIAVIAICTVSMSAALRSATDSAQGINRRFGSMPIPAMTLLAARMSANVFRCAIALAIAVVCGHIIGFRFYVGAEHAVSFCLIVLLIGVAFSLVADFLGVRLHESGGDPLLRAATRDDSQLPVRGTPTRGSIPGVDPASRPQPADSQFVYALRALAGDTTRPPVPPPGRSSGRRWHGYSASSRWWCRYIPSRFRGADELRLAMPPARTESENSLRSLVLHTWVQTQRLLIRWGRDLQTVIQALVLPVMFLASLNLVFGRLISSVSGHSALYGSVPMAALVGAVLGSSSAGVCLMRERSGGLLARFWVLPVHRASGLLSRLAAEVVRILATTVVVLGTGLVLGFRFQQGILAALAWLVVPAVFGVAFSFLVITLALRLVNTVLAEATGILMALLVFFCTGFVRSRSTPAGSSRSCNISR